MTLSVDSVKSGIGIGRVSKASASKPVLAPHAPKTLPLTENIERLPRVLSDTRYIRPVRRLGVSHVAS
jgi:hypothetical protein